MTEGFRVVIVATAQRCSVAPGEADRQPQPQGPRGSR
jgi:hypothetical protein